MAKARKTTVVETKTVEVDVEKIVLELDKDEAQTLADILNRIGGDFTTRRRLTGKMQEALFDADIRPGDNVTDISPTAKSIYFL